MANYSLVFAVAVAVSLAFTAASAAALADVGNKTLPSAYEMLERYNFPRGILPEGVQGYVLRPDGGFEVYFPRDCEFMLAKRYLVRYGRRIAGTARAGSLSGLDGVSVKVLFLWVGVSEVDRAGDRLSFYVGPFSASFPLSVFSESPHCRGFDLPAATAAAS